MTDPVLAYSHKLPKGIFTFETDWTDVAAANRDGLRVPKAGTIDLLN